MMTLQCVLWRGVIAFGLALTGVFGGYALDTPSTPVVEAHLARSAPDLAADAWPARAKPMQSSMSRRHAPRSTRMAMRVSTWNQGDLLR